MKQEKRWDKIKKIFRNPYRVVIFNDQNLHIIRQVRFNAKNFLGAILLAIVFIIASVTIIIAFTPLREYIPGYPSSKMRHMLIRNVLVVDSLEQEAQRRDLYFKNFRLMLAGESPADTVINHGAKIDKEKLLLTATNQDSLFKEEIAAEKLNPSKTFGSPSTVNISNLQFTCPAHGIVTSKHDLTIRHFGVDIVGKLNAPISVALDGTVIYAGLTTDTGNVIYVQHESNLITVYRHNAELLKVQGDKVRAGETIAVMGNTGKETTGPHLHFEMWLNGLSINPEEYIKF
jgi:murein DD-endopeptidase MepM/ murein hydrolase activator NlpD